MVPDELNEPSYSSDVPPVHESPDHVMIRLKHLFANDPDVNLDELTGNPLYTFSLNSLAAKPSFRYWVSETVIKPNDPIFLLGEARLNPDGRIEITIDGSNDKHHLFARSADYIREKISSDIVALTVGFFIMLFVGILGLLLS